MSFVTLFSDERGFIATDQLVYSKEEVSHLNNALASAHQLSDRISQQQFHLDQASEKGFAEGALRGQESAELEGKEAVAKQLLELQQRYDTEVQEIRESCANLAVDIVRKIAGDIKPVDWLYAEATTAAKDLLEKDHLVLRVHHSKVDELNARLSSDDANPFAHVIADESMEIDACSIETRHGRIDVGLNSQIDKILSALNSDSAG